MYVKLAVVCVFPWLPTPWTNGAGAALWLGLAQDALLPTALGLVDGRFNSWVSKAYRCGRGGRRKQQDKIPHGLDGKFRPFSSTTQTLEVAPIVTQVRTRPIAPPQVLSQSDHKFPITNGSLYTSIDGRLPIIHNYRRHKGLRSPIHSISMGLHSTYVKRQESMLNQHIPVATQYQTQETCDDSFISLPADYTSIGSTFSDTKSNLDITKVNMNPQICSQNHLNKSRSSFNRNKKLSSSQNGLSEISIIENELKKARMSKSQSNIPDANVTQREIQKFRINPEIYQKQNLILSKMHSEKDIESSDDEYFNNSITFNDDLKNYDTISSQSCCSITTEANCDFEFFAQQNDTKPALHSYHLKNGGNMSPKLSDSYIMCLSPNKITGNNKKLPVMRSFKPLICKTLSDSSSNTVSNEGSEGQLKTNLDISPKSDTKIGKNFRIRRTNSKRSLENLDTYLNDSSKIERTNSNRSCDLLRSKMDKGTYVIRSNSNKSYDIMRSYPNISETNLLCRKPSITRLNLKNLNSSCIHFSDNNDRYNGNFGKIDKQRNSTPVLSMESLSNVLNHRGISYLDNGDICNHNYGGSVPDFKKIFVSEFI